MVFSNVIVDISISCCSFVFNQSCAKISSGFTNVSGLPVAAFDLVYCFLSVLQFVLIILSLTLVSSSVKWLSVGVQCVYCKVVVCVRNAGKILAEELLAMRRMGRCSLLAAKVQKNNSASYIGYY